VGVPTDVPTSTPTASTLPGPTAGPGVPTGAFLSPTDLGDGWRNVVAPALPCAPTFRRTAIRSVGLAESRGTLSETIATGVDIPAAVAAWRESLQACRYDVRADALGDAGIGATSQDGTDRLLVTGTEGVLIVLHAHGGLAAAGEEMESWADFALGTSCVAAPDGCH